MIACKICFEDIADESIVKYRLSEIDKFKTFDYCNECLEDLMNTQWEKYITNLKKVDCEKSLLSLVKDGTPTNFRDNCIEDNREIYEFQCNNKIFSAKLKGSLDEDKRKELHNRLIDIITNVKNGTDYDYLGNIDKLLKEFNL
jgi:hypothetical protein